MGEGHLRSPLRWLRVLSHRTEEHARPSRRWLNDAPRAPPLSAAERISDASSADFADAPSDAPSARTSISSRGHICVICLDDVEPGGKRRRLPCDHSLWHAACCDKWLRHSPRCPLCNLRVSSCAGECGVELAWTLYDRRVHVVEQPGDYHAGASLRDVEEASRFSSGEFGWLLHERRLSLVSRPERSWGGLPPGRRFGRVGLSTAH